MNDYVNQKTIDGIVYTAWRDSADPAVQYISKDDNFVQCRLKDVWGDEGKIVGLF